MHVQKEIFCIIKLVKKLGSEHKVSHYKFSKALLTGPVKNAWQSYEA